MHDVEFGDLAQVVSETLPALARLRSSGAVRFVGATGLPLASLRTLLATAPPGALDTLLSYCHHTLLDDTLVGLLPAAAAAGVGVMNASPFSMGLLTPAGPPDWHPAPDGVKAACAAAAAACPLLPRLALRHAVAHPGLATTFVGMCTTQQVRDNVAAVVAALAPPAAAAGAAGAEEAEAARQLGVATALLAPVHNVTWPSGRPENN